MRAHHRPVPLPSLDFADTRPDPAVLLEAAHATARLVITPRAADGSSLPAERTEEETARFVALADEVGLETIAEVWSAAPPVSLPGSLWRLFALRSAIVRSPAQIAEEYDAGARAGTVSVAEAVAGVEDPPGPDEVASVAEAILAGAFSGDYALALARASAFVSVCAVGRECLGRGDGARSFERLAADLAAAAGAHRDGHLD